MKALYGLNHPLPVRGSSVCPGIFDGVHLGHQKVILRAVREAKRGGWAAIALTMDPHPSRVLKPRRPHPLVYSLKHRLIHLAELGLDYCVILRFTKRFSRLSALGFVRDILVKKLRVRRIFVGPDYRFGHGAKGDVSFLESLEGSYGFKTVVIERRRSRKRVISSTRLRELIRRGRFNEARDLTARPVSLYGTVVRGRGLGRKMGYPTVNVDVHHETLPPAGVYAIKAQSGHGRYRGVLHLGPVPTFRRTQTSVEAHLFHVRRSLYGREIELILIHKIRNIRRFRTAEDLKRQIREDIRACRRYLTR